MLSTKLKEAAGNSADATLYVDDVFSTWLYTGTGANQTITNGIDLAGKGGMVWLKTRNVANHHYLTDTARGVNSQLSSNTTAGAETLTNRVTSFNSSGFSIGTSSHINGNGETQVSWTFREAPKFFDVVTWSGNSTNNRAISHNLASTPGCIFVKKIGGDGQWATWHRAFNSGNGYAYLNLTNGFNTNGGAVWGSYGSYVAPTSTTFTVSAESDVNANGQTYVAYLFAHDAGGFGTNGTDNIISCGSFTTATSDLTVTLGYEPQYVLFKRTDSTGDWQCYDTMRGMTYNGARALYPNLSSAEGVSASIQPTATGFLVNTNYNSSFIYIAIRMPNKPPTTGTQVFGLNARTGTGANATVTGGQTDDAVLIKNRGSAVGDLFSSRLTGTGYVETSSTAAEVAAGTTILQANPWDVMDGVKVGTNSTITNASANTFINYFFKRSPGFFDEVCYTGNGTTNNLTHNLGVVPEFVIIKRRSTAIYGWFTFNAVGSNYVNMDLNYDAGSSGSYAISTYATSTQVKVGDGGIGSIINTAYNTNAVTCVMYLFATCPGVSKCGSYTGNGTGQDIACGFGSGGARFVLIKRTDSTGGWYTFDSARGLTSGSSPYLLLNSTAAETTGNNGVYASSGGFTLGATAITTTNIMGASYIFLSVA